MFAFRFPLTISLFIVARLCLNSFPLRLSKYYQPTLCDSTRQCHKQWKVSSFMIPLWRNTSKVENRQCEMLLRSFILKGCAGQGNSESDWASTDPATELSSPTSVPFAPSGPPAIHSKFRRKLPSALKLEVPSPRGAVARLHNTCSVQILTSSQRSRANVHGRIERHQLSTRPK